MLRELSGALARNAEVLCSPSPVPAEALELRGIAG